MYVLYENSKHNTIDNPWIIGIYDKDRVAEVIKKHNENGALSVTVACRKLNKYE